MWRSWRCRRQIIFFPRTSKSLFRQRKSKLIIKMCAYFFTFFFDNVDFLLVFSLFLFCHFQNTAIILLIIPKKFSIKVLKKKLKKSQKTIAENLKCKSFLFFSYLGKIICHIRIRITTKGFFSFRCESNSNRWINFILNCNVKF